MQVELSFEVPDSVERLKLTPRVGEVEVASATGFDVYPNGSLVWQKGVQSPTIQLTITPPTLLQMRWPYVKLAATNDYLLGRTPNLTVHWRNTGGARTWNTADLFRDSADAEIRTTVQIAGDGVIGERYLYLGEYRRYTAQANEQTFELIVPDAAQLSASPERLLDAYVAASNWLTFGQKTSPIRVFVGPKPTTGYVSRPQGEMFVADRYRLDVPNSSWIKEYVTMEADLSTDGSRLTFLSGGITEYYARLFHYEVFGGADAPERRLAENLYEFSQGYRDVRLSRPTYPIDYHHKGPAVLYALDREIRSATDGQRTLMDVLTRLSERESVTLSAIEQAVQDVSGESMDSWIERYFTTAAFPHYAFSAQNTSTPPDTQRPPTTDADASPPTTDADASPPTSGDEPPTTAETDSPTTTRSDETGGEHGIRGITITEQVDADGDGYASAVEFEVDANTTVVEDDLLGAGDPYVEIRVDGESVTNTSELAAEDRLTTTIRLGDGTLTDVPRGRVNVTLVLWDGDVFTSERIDEQSFTFRYEPSSEETPRPSATDLVVENNDTEKRVVTVLVRTTEDEIVNASVSLPAGATLTLHDAVPRDVSTVAIRTGEGAEIDEPWNAANCGDAFVQIDEAGRPRMRLPDC